MQLSAPSSAALTAALCGAVEELRERVAAAAAEHSEHTASAWARLEERSFRASEELASTRIERDQAVARAEESETRRVEACELLERERELRAIAETSLRMRDQALSEMRERVRCAEEASRREGERSERLQRLVEEERAASVRKASEKREACASLEAACWEMGSLRRAVHSVEK